MLRRIWTPSVLFLASISFCQASAYAYPDAYSDTYNEGNPHAYSSVCTAKDLFTGDTFTQSGGSEQAARVRALEECRAKTGNVCVAHCVDKDISGGYDTLLYSCLTSDETGRTWVEVGPTLNIARDASLVACFKDAGVTCRTQSCSFVH